MTTVRLTALVATLLFVALLVAGVQHAFSGIDAIEIGGLR